jgi:hypothetical protein
MTRSATVLLSVLLVAATAQGEELYLGVNPSDTGGLTLVGIHDGTSFHVTGLDDGIEIASGELDRFDVELLDIPAVHHVSVVSSTALLVHLGYDCCGVGGTYFVPTEDGHAFVGRAFLAYFPSLGTSSEVVVFSVEGGDVVFTDRDGVPVASRTLEAGRAWIPYPVVSSRPYLIRSTGDIAVMVSAVNGLSAVPPAARDESCDNDVGRTFYLTTHSWGGGAVAVFAYEDATVSVVPLEGGDPVLHEVLAAGGWAFARNLGRRSFRATSTGDIAVWTGDLEGGETIADIGDDFSCNLGRRGRDVIVHSQNHGATIFAGHDDTTITIDGDATTLDRAGWVDVEPGTLVHATASRPVVAFTYGGNVLNDWGGVLRPVPADEVEHVCPDLDADLPSPPDAGTDADGDSDIDEGDLDADRDSGFSDADTGDLDNGDVGPRDTEPRRSCDCAAPGAASSARQLVGLLFVALFGVVGLV